MKLPESIPSSFRDPSGFLFKDDGILYRHIGHSYRDHYEYLMHSGLYKILIEKKLLIAHAEVALEYKSSFKVIRPQKIPFISYPYEWCFSQLKTAAQTTLEIQKLAIEQGMSLKDASGFNIQFCGSQPLLIDTLSFERYKENQPWVAYRQFCQHFLAPLSLMAKKDIRLDQLLRIYLDGIPLDLASRLLPWSSYFSPGLMIHIHVHAKTQAHFSAQSSPIKNTTRKFSKLSMLGLVDQLMGCVNALKLPTQKTEWGAYYENTNYSGKAFEEKKSKVEQFLKQVRPKTAWDLGANTGVFSKLAVSEGAYTVSFDNDPLAIEKNYLLSRTQNETQLLPLLLDLTNPSPGLGWSNTERDSLMERGPVDVVMALALIHHLAISNNLPLEKIAGFFKKMTKHLIIEFVPKSDSQVKRLLSTREDIFENYTREGFEKAFLTYFKIQAALPLVESERVLYLMSAL